MPRWCRFIQPGGWQVICLYKQGLHVKGHNKEETYAVSRLRSLTIMYLPIKIQPQRNHRIWLLCPVVMALRPLRYSPKLLTKTMLGGWSRVFFLPTLKLLIPPMKSVAVLSRKLMYFLAMLTDERVYSSTGLFHPSLPFIIPASQVLAP